jgi:hypothetical protein
LEGVMPGGHRLVRPMSPPLLNLAAPGLAGALRRPARQMHNALIPVAQRDQEAFRALMIVAATLAGAAPALGAITLLGHWLRPGIQAAGVKTGERR